jgi:glucose-6-phosphate 1-epimerase
MQSLGELNDHFSLPGALSFDQTETGLLRAHVSTPTCTAELYLHGAHLTHWQPAGHTPVLFLSDRSEFAADKAIRGGVPVIFPWFGPRTATAENPRTDGPAHGFARLQTWTVMFAAISGNDLHLTLALAPGEQSRALGFDHFQLAYTLVLGADLRLRLTVANQSESPLQFEEALHTYLAVGDATQVSLSGLGDTEYLDKTDNFARKRQTDPILHLTGTTDRPYLNTEATVTLTDPTLHRKLTVAKQNSKTTVVWNPWAELCAKLHDMPPDGWRTMTCVETANAGENAVTLGPRETHTMESHITVEREE